MIFLQAYQLAVRLYKVAKINLKYQPFSKIWWTYLEVLSLRKHLNQMYLPFLMYSHQVSNQLISSLSLSRNFTNLMPPNNSKLLLLWGWTRLWVLLQMTSTLALDLKMCFQQEVPCQDSFKQTICNKNHLWIAVIRSLDKWILIKTRSNNSTLNLTARH